MKVIKSMPLFVLLILTVSLVPISPVSADNLDKWAVVVGVEGGGATHLDNDAQDFANVLVSRYGYQSSRMQLLLNGAATKSAVLGALDWLISQETNESCVAVFFSCHGDYHKVFLSDAALADTELAAKLTQLETKKVVVVVVACRSGSFLDISGSVPGGILITACTADEATYDVENYQNTIFVYNFVDKGMAQGLADSNQDGNITVEEAFYYAEPRCHPLIKIVQDTHPQMVDNYTGEFNLTEPVHAPWFTSLPMALLATVSILSYQRRKKKQTVGL